MIPNTQFRSMLPCYQRVNGEQAKIIMYLRNVFQKIQVCVLVIYNKGNIALKNLWGRGEYLINIISDFLWFLQIKLL